MAQSISTTGTTNQINATAAMMEALQAQMEALQAKMKEAEAQASKLQRAQAAVERLKKHPIVRKLEAAQAVIAKLQSSPKPTGARRVGRPSVKGANFRQVGSQSWYILEEALKYAPGVVFTVKEVADAANKACHEAHALHNGYQMEITSNRTRSDFEDLVRRGIFEKVSGGFIRLPE